MNPNVKYFVVFLTLLGLILSLATIPSFSTNFIYAQPGVETNRPNILKIVEANKIIGTQSTQETPNGKKVRCSGNLIMPKIICTGTSENDTIVASPSGGEIYAQDGNDFSELTQSSQVDNRFYSDSKQTLVSQKINRSTTNGVELVGNVTYVVDGDTLDINGIRVRLSLVDTPEGGQPGFKEAKEFVKSLCLGKNGELDVDDGQRRGDRYGREIGIVYCNGVNINEKLVNEGLARILTDYCDISEFSNQKWAAACSNSSMIVAH